MLGKGTRMPPVNRPACGLTRLDKEVAEAIFGMLIREGVSSIVIYGNNYRRIALEANGKPFAKALFDDDHFERSGQLLSTNPPKDDAPPADALVSFRHPSPFYLVDRFCNDCRLLLRQGGYLVIVPPIVPGVIRHVFIRTCGFFSPNLERHLYGTSHDRRLVTDFPSALAARGFVLSREHRIMRFTPPFLLRYFSFRWP